MADFIVILHSYNVYLIIAAATISGIFGLVLYFKSSPKSDPKKSLPEQEKNEAPPETTEAPAIQPAVKWWRISLLTTLGLSLLQGLFGVTMIAIGLKPGGGTGLYYLHYVYGGIVALGIPLTWLSFTTNGQDKRKDMLFYSIATLIMVAAAIRAWITGPAPM